MGRNHHRWQTELLYLYNLPHFIKPFHKDQMPYNSLWTVPPPPPSLAFWCIELTKLFRSVVGSTKVYSSFLFQPFSRVCPILMCTSPNSCFKVFNFIREYNLWSTKAITWNSFPNFPFHHLKFYTENNLRFEKTGFLSYFVSLVDHH